jgi:hypothetical protein
VTRRRVADAVTSVAAQTFPPSRRADARVVRDCARDAIDASGVRAMARETVALAFAGLRVRCRTEVRDVRQAPWRPALEAMTLPLAAVVLGVWTFGFVSRYDHWPLGESWALLLGGSLLAVIGAACRARWAIVVGAGAAFVAAAWPYVGLGADAAMPGGPRSVFYGWGVDLGASSLLVAPLLVGAALLTPRGPRPRPLAAAGRLLLGLGPAAVALVYALPAPKPEPGPIGGLVVIGEEPVLQRTPPHPFPWIPESEPLLDALGIALVVAVAYAWGAARTRPAAALATALVLVSVAFPFAWKLHGHAVWPTILIPLAAAIALTLRAAHAAQRSSTPTQGSSPEPAASR